MEFSGKELIQGRAGRLLLPLGRPARHVRGPRLYGVGSDRPMPSSRTTRCASPRRSAPITARRWTRKRRFCAPWRRLNRQALRILRLFGTRRERRSMPPSARSRSISSSTGTIYEQRPDLIYTGRTLFGARPAKGQELEDHYFGALKPRVAAFMARSGSRSCGSWACWPRPSTTRSPPRSTSWRRSSPPPTSPPTTTS